MVVVGLVLTVSPRTSSACSCSGFHWGGGHFYVGEGGLLPLGAKGIPWSGGGKLESNDKRISLTSGGERVPFHVEVHGAISYLVPEVDLPTAEPLKVCAREEHFERGVALRAEGPDLRLPPPEVCVDVRFSNVELSLATVVLSAEPPRTVGFDIAGESCNMGVYASTVQLSTSLSHGDRRFAEHLLYQTYVDGSEWKPAHHLCDTDNRHPGRSWVPGAGLDMLYAGGCGSRHGGIGEGMHTVHVEVSTPDLAMQARSPDMRLKVECDSDGTPVIVLPDSPAAVVLPAAVSTPPTNPEGTKKPLTTPRSEPQPLDSNDARGCVLGRERTDSSALLPLLFVVFCRRRSTIRRDPRPTTRGRSPPPRP